MNKAIRLAIEGGYMNLKKHNIDWDKMYVEDKPIEERILLDPLFWQALFKENGKIRAVEFMGFIYDGGKVDDYFNEKLN